MVATNLLICGIIIFYTSSLNELISLKEFTSNFSELKNTQNQYNTVILPLCSPIYFHLLHFSIPIASLLTIFGGSLFSWNAFILIIFQLQLVPCIYCYKNNLYEFLKIKQILFK